VTGPAAQRAVARDLPDDTENFGPSHILLAHRRRRALEASMAPTTVTGALNTEEVSA
jgi:hypothetical protein